MLRRMNIGKDYELGQSSVEEISFNICRPRRSRSIEMHHAYRTDPWLCRHRRMRLKGIRRPRAVVQDLFHPNPVGFDSPHVRVDQNPSCPNMGAYPAEGAKRESLHDVLPFESLTVILRSVLERREGIDNWIEEEDQNYDVSSTARAG